MAKALQCPECGERHPLADLAGTKTFRCRSCGRLLKVPAEAVAAGAGGRGGGAADPDATAAMPVARGGSKVPPSQRGVDLEQARRPDPGVPPRVPRSLRIAAWVVAIPIGLLPVLLVGRAIGLLTVEAAVDMFIGVGWTRFLPPLIVLPVWSALTATVAHFLIEGIARLRDR